MNYKIVTDSGCEWTEELKKEKKFVQIPLTIYIDDKEFRDDEKLDVKNLIREMKGAKSAPRTASPAPVEFMEEYDGDDSVFVVTVSSKISGTFNNAMMAKKMYLEEKRKKFIHIFDSFSASAGQTLICLKILELARQNIGEMEIANRINRYIGEMKTLFLLDSLENLVKSGRINRLVGKIASVLSIKPIMGATPEGNIGLFEQVRGYNRAFRRLIEMVGEIGGNLEEKVLSIAHCNALEKAEAFKKEILKRYNFKDIIIVPMNGAISMYADEGGIVIAF